MRSIVAMAGLFAVPATTAIENHRACQVTPDDPRLIRVRSFFHTYDCPLSAFAEDFIRAADENDLDWRLLPSISFLESSGGMRASHNNIFGWNSKAARFSSQRAAIDLVASRLRTSKLYKNKRLLEVLRT